MAVMMFFIAGANVRYLLVLLVLGTFLVAWVYFWWKHDKTVQGDENKLSYITDRIDNFMADNKSAISKKTIHYQSEQALIAIWSWGLTGLGFWNSIQKYWYLPEVQWDFIFSVIAEELGFVWVLVLLSLFSYISYRAFYISYYSVDLFARYYAFGFACWILMQSCINIWVNLNIVPLTWITLPFVSYGGSSLLALSMWLGLLLNVSRFIDISKTRSGRKKMLFRTKVFMK
jgi:cell division protein FtsW